MVAADGSAATMGSAHSFNGPENFISPSTEWNDRELKKTSASIRVYKPRCIGKLI